MIGISEVASSTGNLAGVGGTTGGMSALAVKAYQAPPDAFFAPLPSDGWMEFTPPDMPTGESIRIRMHTRDGQVIDGSFIATKKIGTFEGWDWRSMVTAGSGASFFTSFGPAIYKWLNYNTDWDPADPTKIANFYANTNKYRLCSSFWDYIVWAHIASHASMEAAINRAYIFYPDYNFMAQPPRSPLTSYPRLGTPEATDSDKMGTQEVQVTGTDPHGGTVNFTCTVSTDAEGRPVSQTGLGTITRPDGVTMEVEFTMDFADGKPTSGTMHLRIPPPDDLHIVMTMYATGSAEGNVYSPSTAPAEESYRIGRIVVYASPDSEGHKGYYEDKATGTKEYF